MTPESRQPTVPPLCSKQRTFPQVLDDVIKGLSRHVMSTTLTETCLDVQIRDKQDSTISFKFYKIWYVFVTFQSNSYLYESDIEVTSF